MIEISSFIWVVPTTLQPWNRSEGANSLVAALSETDAVEAEPIGTAGGADGR